MNFYEANLICPATPDSIATTVKAQRQLQHELDLNTAMWALWPEPESMELSSTEDTPKELPRNIPLQSTEPSITPVTNWIKREVASWPSALSVNMRYLLLTQLRQLQQREGLQDINWQTVIPWTRKFANDRKDQYYWYRLAETYPHSQRAQINHMRKENRLITLESSQRLIIPVEKVWHQLEHVSEKGRHQLDHVSAGSIKLTFSIRDLESPYSYPAASESASSSDGETPHDDYSEAPNPESSTLPQDEPLSSQDGVIEQAQDDDGVSWKVKSSQVKVYSARGQK